MTKTHEEMQDVVGEIINIFEDYLTDKGFTFKDFPSKEREEYADGDLTDLALIFGSDYGRLEDQIEDLLGDKLK